MGPGHIARRPGRVRAWEIVAVAFGRAGVDELVPPAADEEAYRAGIAGVIEVPEHDRVQLGIGREPGIDFLDIHLGEAPAHPEAPSAQQEILIGVGTAGGEWEPAQDRHVDVGFGTGLRPSAK